MMIKKILKLIFPIFLPLLILFLLFREINLLTLDLSKFSLSILVVSIILFFFIKLINTYRYSNIYNLKPSQKLYSLLCYSNMMLSLVPLRLGEFSYIHGFKKYFNVSYQEATQKLFLIRFIDYIVVYSLLLISSIYVSANLRGDYIGILSIFFSISLILALGILIWLTKSDYIFKNKRLNGILITLKKGAKGISSTSMGRLTVIILQTLFYWTLRLILGYVCLLLLGINISIFYFVFISLFFLLVGLLPIQTFANFGIFEAGWAYFLVNIGYNYSEVLPLLLVYHFILLIPMFVYGSISYILLKISFKTDKSYNH